MREIPLPSIPTTFTHHLICFECVPQKGRDDLDLDLVLRMEELEGLKSWREYSFVTASRTDYAVKIAADTHGAGNNGK